MKSISAPIRADENGKVVESVLKREECQEMVMGLQELGMWVERISSMTNWAMVILRAGAPGRSLETWEKDGKDCKTVSLWNSI